ncbi:MAG: hypothetical protein ACYTG4_10875 [Planctomycetota bacterium]|jgi:hypothetical protein
MNDILGDDPETSISILGVNGIGYESGNAAVTAGRDLPWLQDVAESNSWVAWGITYRDVLILDRQNRPVATFNLTENDLNVSANFDALRNLLEAAEDL